MNWLRNFFVPWSLSGLLLGVGFLFPIVWPLGIVGGIYFLYLLQQQVPTRQKLLGAWLAWSSKAACSAGCLLSVYPIEWLPYELGEVQLAVIGFTWFMTSVSLSVGVSLMVLFIAVMRKLTDLPQWSYYVLIYPLLWVISEALGSVAFSVFFYGPGGDINASFSSGYVGYLLASHEGLLQVARISGVYGLSLVFVLLAGLLLWLLQQHTQYRYAVLGGLVLLYVSGMMYEIKPPAPTPSSYAVVAIDTHLGSNLLRSEEGQKQAVVALETAMEKALVLQPDYIILPEDSRYFDQSQPVSTTKTFFEMKYGKAPVVVIDSGRATNNGDTVLQAYIYNGLEDSVERYHKRYLVPQGEFISNIYVGLFRLFNYSESLAYLAQGISYRVGPWTNQAPAAANVPGILFCFESFAPRGVKTLSEERKSMPFVAHIASHAWFHDPYTLWSQMESMMRVQAVWSGQYVVSVGNMMPGKFYTPEGAVLDMEVVERGEEWQIKQVTIPRS